MAKLAFLALLAVMVSSAALACPSGFQPCGETNQLCCPL
jgi:hypothetical protein